jgi:hypothetical protein
MGEGLQLKYEFLDADQNSLGSYTTTDDDLFKGYFNLPQTYSNVVYVKISNPNDNSFRAYYAIFGDPETVISDVETAVKMKFMVNESWNSTYYFYDEPNADSHYVTNTNDIRGKTYYTTKAFGYTGNSNFSWYQVSIPEEGIINKWVRNGVPDFSSSSLFNVVSNQIAEGNNVSTDSSGTSFYGNASYKLTEFNMPITVSKAYIWVDHPAMGEGLQLKYEFLDADQNSLGSYTTTDDDLFKGYFNLPETYSNVVYVKISNPNENSFKAAYGIFGDPETLSL